MNKLYLQSQVKSTGTAYLFFFLFGFHYIYLGKWFTQILFWLTLGGIGIWALIDLFTISDKVNSYNAKIFQQIEDSVEKAKGEEKKCPMCAESVKYEAKICKHCSHEFPTPKIKELK